MTKEVTNCPCGDDCEKVLAECCGEFQNRCETVAYQDFRLCHIDEGCTTPKGGRTYE